MKLFSQSALSAMAATLLVLLSGADRALAGVDSSGGGAAIVCRDSNHRIASAQMLDLYEGEIRFGLAIGESSGAPQEQLARIQERLSQYNFIVGMDFQSKLEEIKSRLTYLPDGIVMAPGVDLGSNYAAVIPDGCELTYVGYYESDGTVRLSRTVFNKFSATHQAAFLAHEALYALARRYSGSTSAADSRKLTAYLFAAASNLRDLDSIIGRFTWDQFGGARPVIVKKGCARFEFKFKASRTDVEGYACEVQCKDSRQQIVDRSRSETRYPAVPMTLSLSTQNCREIQVSCDPLWTIDRPPVFSIYGNLKCDGEDLLTQDFANSPARIPVYFK